MRSLARLVPFLFVTALCFGASAPALADIEPEPEPTPKEKKEKQDKGDKGDKGDKANKDEAKSGGCSVEPNQIGLAGFAGLVLVISAATLRRRSR